MKYEATTGIRPKKGLAERLLGSYVDDLQKLSCNDMAAFRAVQQVHSSLHKSVHMWRSAPFASTNPRRQCLSIPSNKM